MSEVTTIHATQALVQGAWHRDVRMTCANARIQGIALGASRQSGDSHHEIAVPAVPNLHSHAFQRGMAGLAERRHLSSDTFWTWREVMYRFALSMTPEQVEAVAAQAFMEMLETGFVRVGEFHYLHHDVDGCAYSNIAEMAERVAAAAQTTGMGLTLLPVFYAHAAFGGVAPTTEQRRFINTIDDYARLLEGCRAAVKPLNNGIVGIAPHSLRAVTPDELIALIPLAGDKPIHIHIAEQMAEVNASVAWSGQRPVEWLLDHAPVDARWCLVHATHMTESETTRAAASGATAGLCPITEANLGDGVFNAPQFLAAGGRFGVGSDSNVQIGAAEELRLLEYSQRLLRQSRNVIGATGASTGRTLFDGAVSGGGAAVGITSPALTVGAPADIITLNANHATLAACGKGDDILDAWIFSAGSTLVDCVWAGGKKVVECGIHIEREQITRRFTSVMKALCAQ